MRLRLRGVTAVLASLLVVAGLLAVASLTTSSAQAVQVDAARSTGPTVTSRAMSAQRQNDKIVYWVNRHRERLGRKPVRRVTCVTSYADDWAKYLVSRDKWEHSDLGRLIRRCNASYASENLAMYPDGMTPRAVVRMWMNSEGHRRNILSRYPRTTGVSVRWDDNRNAWYAVLNFARP